MKKKKPHLFLPCVNFMRGLFYLYIWLIVFLCCTPTLVLSHVYCKDSCWASGNMPGLYNPLMLEGSNSRCWLLGGPAISSWNLIYSERRSERFRNPSLALCLWRVWNRRLTPFCGFPHLSCHVEHTATFPGETHLFFVDCRIFSLWLRWAGL